MTKSFKNLLALNIMMFFVLAGFNSFSGEILLQTGFEDDEVGKIPEKPADTWQVSGGGFEIDNSRAKEGKNSLAMLGGGGDQALAALIDTQSQVVTAEFWLYVDGAERSLTVFVQDPNSGLTDWAAAGPYLNWIDGNMRHYPGAWEEIGPFASDEWHYIRLVINTGESTFDIYAGDSVAEVHSGEPLGKGLGFRSDVAGPPGKVSFGTYGLVTPAYVDDLLIYEGGVLPEGIFAVNPADKLSLTWGEIKRPKF